MGWEQPRRALYALGTQATTTITINSALGYLFVSDSEPIDSDEDLEALTIEFTLLMVHIQYPKVDEFNPR